MQFVLELREWLRETIAHANKHAMSQQTKSKARYDQKARDGSFEPGQELLALLPLAKNPLQTKYFELYKVLEKLGLADYLIDTPGRKKTQRVYHVIF